MVDPLTMSSTYTHLAGPLISYGDHQRQRCLWCGFALIDQDLSRMAFQIPPCRWCSTPYTPDSPVEGECQRSEDSLHQWGKVEPPGGFPLEAFVTVTLMDGFRLSHVIEEAELERHEDESIKVPEDCCMRLPAELTALPPGADMGGVEPGPLSDRSST